MDKKLVWRAKEIESGPKSRNWYWSVGILTAGGALASVVASNILLALLILLGGFAIMLAGTRPRVERRCAFSERGVHIDANIVPWDKIKGFALKEDATPLLLLQTETLLGITTIPLSGIDHRDVIMELKNRNIEEMDSLDTFTESITRALGL